MIDRMNKQMKIFLNEASGISSKCKLKLVKLVEKHFFVKLPHENFLNIDIEILEDGNIQMRDVLYQTSNPISSLKELESRFHAFQEEADHLINRNEVNFETMSVKKDRNNLIWVILITIAILIILFHVLRRLFSGDFYSVFWIVIMIGYYIIPATGNGIRNRYVRAYRYLKSKFKK